MVEKDAKVEEAETRIRNLIGEERFSEFNQSLELLIDIFLDEYFSTFYE